VPILREVLASLPFAVRVHGRDDIPVTGVSADSRTLTSGMIFVAVRGRRDDGHRYIPDALARGARAIVSDQDPPMASAVAWVTVPDSRAALGWLAAFFAGFPTRGCGLVGVTGTDGKTTTATLIAYLLRASGQPVGLVSTVEIWLGDERRPNDTQHTTPPAAILQGLLAEMVQRGCRWAVLETSSHALDQWRVAGCLFDVGVFTNLTPEHLDYHGDLERYRQAKARLFALLGQEPKAGITPFGLLNADDPHSAAMAAACPVTVVTYGLEQPAHYRVRRFGRSGEGMQVLLETPAGPVDLWSPLPGRFNVYNVAAAAAATLQLGVAPMVLTKALRTFTGVPGRLQPVVMGQPFQVFVDFAHTPNALGAVLAALRPRTRGRLIVVFGHPGGRDAHNRPVLGRVAASMADLLILTTDDPYDEDPEAILDQIEVGVRAAGRRPHRDFWRFPDRVEAIRAALRLAQPGDTVLIAGRGHERFTVVRGQRVPLDDVAVVEQTLRELAAESGPAGVAASES
jgi:UDP-N-acetylmuramoyl-L-alanyl-D-glutamate--2,6-diaminopimelate ligase